MAALAASVPPGADADVYGGGALFEEFERDVAALLGKPAAVFCVSGKAAQLSALRVHAERRGRTLVACHPRSHIVEDENDAIGALYGLRVARVGALHAPFSAADVDAVREPLAAVTLELPLRRAGYLVPPWDETVAIANAARRAGAAFHIDGARLWEAAPGYGKTPAEIAALADTVYVSFYKGLGGLAGAVLAGEEDVVAAARVWIARAGATLFRAYPYVVAARVGLRDELPRMSAYVAYATALATALRGLPGVAVSADPPSCNAFIVYVEGDRDALFAARDAIEAERGIRLFGPNLARTSDPRTCSFEVVVAANSLELDVADVRSALAELVTRASSR